MLALIIAVAVIVGFGLLLAWTARDIAPNKRKPESRYRGKTLADVEAQLGDDCASVCRVDILPSISFNSPIERC